MRRRLLASPESCTQVANLIQQLIQQHTNKLHNQSEQVDYESDSSKDDKQKQDMSSISSDNENSSCMVINQQQFLQSDKSNTKTDRSAPQQQHAEHLQYTMHNVSHALKKDQQYDFNDTASSLLKIPTEKRRLDKISVHLKKNKGIAKIKEVHQLAKNKNIQSTRQTTVKLNSDNLKGGNASQAKCKSNSNITKNRRKLQVNKKPKSTGKKKDDMSNRIFNAIIDHFM